MRVWYERCSRVRFGHLSRFIKIAKRSMPSLRECCNRHVVQDALRRRQERMPRGLLMPFKLKARMAGGGVESDNGSKPMDSNNSGWKMYGQ